MHFRKMYFLTGVQTIPTLLNTKIPWLFFLDEYWFFRLVSDLINRLNSQRNESEPDLTNIEYGIFKRLPCVIPTLITDSYWYFSFSVW